MKSRDGSALALFAFRITRLMIALLKNLMSKFSGGLKPSKITTSVGSFKMELEFQKARMVIALLGYDAYETAVEGALVKAAADPNSGLKGEKWTLSEPQISVLY